MTIIPYPLAVDGQGLELTRTSAGRHKDRVCLQHAIAFNIFAGDLHTASAGEAGIATNDLNVVFLEQVLHALTQAVGDRARAAYHTGYFDGDIASNVDTQV